MKKKNRWVCVFLGCFFICISISSAVFASTIKPLQSKNILIINSYHMGHYWESYVMEGFIEESKKYDESKMNIKVEYLDFRNRHDEEYIKSFIEFIESKYPKGSIDIIYTIDDEAFSAVLPEITKEQSQLYHVPLLFSGVDSNIEFTEEENNYVSGIYQRDITLEGINLILQLDDTIDTINIITENSEFGNNLVSQATDIVNKHLGYNIELNIIQSDYIQDIENQLLELSSRTSNPNSNEVIFLGGEFQDINSKIFLNPNKTVEKIRSYMSWPIYTNDPTYLSSNILGGCMDIGQLQGAEIFSRANRMIEGENLSKIESDFAPQPKLLLKYKGIYEHNIDIKNIPRKCTILDKKFYQLVIPTYMKKIIIIILGIIIITSIYIVHEIISERRKIKKLQEQNKIKDAREKLQTDFIVNISHELRTPINIILSGINVIKLHLKKPEKEINHDYVEEKLDNVTKNAYRLLKLANNIIYVKKIDFDGIVLSKTNINIVELIETIFSETVDYANKKNIKMIFDTNEEEILTLVDVELIQRVVLNLLSNAIKFTLSGGRIYTNVSKENNYIIIEVIDNGIGIPKEKLNEIFERYYQVDNSLSRVNEGSGIGLSIVKELVDLHNGKIEVESEVDKGTKVRVLIPIVYDNSASNTICKISINAAVNTEMADVLK